MGECDNLALRTWMCWERQCRTKASAAFPPASAICLGATPAILVHGKRPERRPALRHTESEQEFRTAARSSSRLTRLAGIWRRTDISVQRQHRSLHVLLLETESGVELQTLEPTVRRGTLVRYDCSTDKTRETEIDITIGLVLNPNAVLNDIGRLFEAAVVES